VFAAVVVFMFVFVIVIVAMFVIVFVRLALRLSGRPGTGLALSFHDEEPWVSLHSLGMAAFQTLQQV
jgi:hypothetical protein